MEETAAQPAETNKEGPGILIRTIEKGDGVSFPKPGDSCLVHYVAYLYNEDEDDHKLIDSTRNRNQPLQFELGARHIILGLEVGMEQISLGQVAELIIPHLYAYGKQGCPPKIPPYSTVMFKIKLLQINDQKAKK